MAYSTSDWENQIKRKIRRRYARQAMAGSLHNNALSRMADLGYTEEMVALLPDELKNAFSGCGCPVAELTLEGGEVVIDLGAGAGIDSFLVSQMLVSGMVISIDMTEEMLALHRPETRGVPINLVTGDLERLPIDDCTADIVIANASFNLTINKETAYREAYRILKPGGKLTNCDLVLDGDLPREVLEDPLAHETSLGGVVEENTMRTALEAAGFTEIEISNYSQYSFVVAVLITARRGSTS